MPPPDTGIPEWDRARLEQGLRGCDSRALVAFYAHFRPILGDRAQLFGIPPGDRADAIETFLGDLLLSLCSANELPRSLHAYVFVSFRRFATRLKRADVARTDSLQDVETDQPNCGPPPDEDAIPPGNESLTRFSLALIKDLSADERLMLAAAAEEMPLRELAVLLHVNYNAANTRLCRLRSRLRAMASTIVSRMDLRDRQVVERFLRRAGANQLEDTALDRRDQKQRRSTNG